MIEISKPQALYCQIQKVVATVAPRLELTFFNGLRKKESTYYFEYVLL
jgi:hypothetical protein